MVFHGIILWYYTFIEFILLSYTFLVISFDQYKEYMIFLISFNKFSDVLPAFTFAKVIGNLLSICLGVDIFSPFPCVSFIGNLPFFESIKS